MPKRQRYARTNWAASEAIPAAAQCGLPLTRNEVLAAESWWGGAKRLAWESQWSAIQMIADDIWRTAETDVERLHRLWVSLSYAVGNFKRQGNASIFPLPVPWKLAALPGTLNRQDSLSFAVDGRTIILKSTGTTAHLAAYTRGLASVPTGSTILAALWPDEHAIMDRRDFQAAVGLLAHAGASIMAPGSAERLYAANWSEYRWFRLLIKAEAKRLKLPSLTLERALCVAYAYAPHDAIGMTWAKWGAELKSGWPAHK